MWLSCTFEIEAEEPFKLVSVAIQPTSPPEMGLSEISEWETLSDLLEQMRQSSGIPAIAVAVVDNGEIDQAAVGVREINTEKSVELSDCFHVGSVAKSITATMIGCLVEQGVLDWGSTIGATLGDIDMRAEYREVTLVELLQHRAGLPAYTTFDDEEEARLAGLPGTPTEQRATFVAEVLQSKATGPAAGDTAYSNAGYVVAGYMAERASGKTWEKLVTELVLDPAGMKTAGFGWPATVSTPNEPHGHFSDGSTFRAQAIGEYPLGSFMAPAGDVRAAVGDLALYAQMHLSGLAGKDGVLSAITIKKLHTPPVSGNDKMGYACGWVISESEDLGAIHFHSGSAGTFYAVVELYPVAQRAIVCVMNIGPDGAAIAEAISDAINARASSR
jgi:CubicO group peptidase (beta-lactamase class C family)